LLRHVSERYNCTGNTRRKYSFLSFNCMSSMKSFSCASHLLGVTFCTFLSFCHSNLLPWISADYGPETVKEINFSSYAGRWYQTHASLLPNITFERNGRILHYSWLSCFNGEFSWYSKCTGVGQPNRLNINGEWYSDCFRSQISWKTGGEVVRKVEVVFCPTIPLELWHEYGFGPLGSDDQYLYSGNDSFQNTHVFHVSVAVVSAPFWSYLFILARDVEKFRTSYRDEVLKSVKKLGFYSIINQPLETYQGPDCKYLPASF